MKKVKTYKTNSKRKGKKWPCRANTNAGTPCKMSGDRFSAYLCKLHEESKNCRFTVAEYEQRISGHAKAKHAKTLQERQEIRNNFEAQTRKTPPALVASGVSRQD